MKTFIWVLTIILLAPWTAGAWLAYAVVDVSGDWMSGNADMLASEPQILETLSWFGRLLSGFGETMIIVIWALGVLFASFIAWLFCRLVNRERRLKATQWHPDDQRGSVAQRIP